MAAQLRDRPGRGVRTCEQCDLGWSRPARYCGRCGRGLQGRRGADGACLDGRRRSGRSGGTTPTVAGASSAGHRLLLLTGALALIGLAVAVSQLDDAITEAPPEGITEVGGEVRVRPPDTSTEVVSSSAATCERSSRDRSACGPRLADDRPSRGALSALPPHLAIVAEAGEVRRYDLPQSEPVWTTVPFHGHADLRLRAHEDAILVSRAGEVALLEVADGALRWRSELAGQSARIPPRAWLIDGDVFVLDTARTLSVLAGQTGELRWAVDQVSPEAIPTTHGVLVSRDGELGLYQAESDEPVWSRPETVPIPHTLLGGRPAEAPVRLLVGRQLLVPATGETLDVRDGAPSTVRVHGDVTLVLRWEDREQPELLALGPDAEVLWARDDLRVPCCVATSFEASDGRIGVGPPHGPHLVLDRTDGSLLWELQRPNAWLEGVSGKLAIWREDAVLVGTDIRSGREAFRADGSIRSLEPLLIAGPGGLVHVTPGSLAPLQPRRTPIEAWRR